MSGLMTQLMYLLSRHGNPVLTFAYDSVLMRVTIVGPTTSELEKDLLWHFRDAKPGYHILFDKDLGEPQRDECHPGCETKNCAGCGPEYARTGAGL